MAYNPLYDFKQTNFPSVSGIINSMGNHPLQNLFGGLTDLGEDFVSGLDSRNVSTIKNAIQTGVLDGKKVNDIVGELRASNPDFTEGQFDRADIQKFRDKESEINYRKAQEAHQRLSTQKMKDEMNYLAQTREADNLMAYLKEQALLQKDAAKFGMADIWNSSYIQKALNSNSQFRDRASEYFKANNFLTSLKDIDPKSKFENLDDKAAELQTELQKNVSAQEMLQSQLGIAPDWNTNPKYKDKAALFESLTKGMDSDDAAETKEQFELQLKNISARLPNLPMEAQLAIVAGGFHKNWKLYDWLGGSTYDFSNADKVIANLEDLSRRKDNNGQSLLNKILDYTVNNQPAINESKKILAEKTFQKLRDAQNTLIYQVESSPYFTRQQKDRYIYNIKYQTQSTIPTLLVNTLAAATQSKNLKEVDLIRDKSNEEVKKYLKEIEQKKQKEKEIADKYRKMSSTVLLP